MPSSTIVRPLLDAQATTAQVLEDFLNDQQTTFFRETVGFQMWETETAPIQRGNFWSYLDNPNADRLEPLKVEIIPDDPDEKRMDAAAQTRATGRHALAYTAASIGGQKVVILISRPGRQITWRGKMSTFGGPDTGMSATEGLALADNHIDKYPDFFVTPALGTLGHNLKSDKPYLACRWDYSVTKPAFLRDPTTFALVTNPVTGKSELARPIDWGPHVSTGRDADLSPGLATRLGLKTNDECIVTLSLRSDQLATPPGPSPAAGAFINALVRISTDQFDRFHKLSEGDGLLRAQIRKYWEDLGFAFPGVGTAWSAVFVSWCVKEAGATAAEFFFAPRHSAFVQRAIQNALGNTGVFRAWPVDRYQPRVGDLIQNNREGGSITYGQATHDDSYFSHSAIVVGFEPEGGKNFALTIGGNEGQSVGRKRVLLTADGFVRQRKNDPYISVVQTLKA